MIIRKRALYRAFLQYIEVISKDAMLILLCLAPVLSGLFFRFGIPFIQSLLTTYLDLPGFLEPYYLLFDLFLGSLTPVLYCFAAAYVILIEIDDGISKYLVVTPIGKTGYLVSRLGFPAGIAFLVSILMLSVFQLTNLSIITIIMTSFAGTFVGIITSLLVVAISGNKVEGMAVSKLSGLFLLGLPAPFFLSGYIQYALFFLPSFWIAKYVVDNNIFNIFVSIIVSVIWMILLYCKFDKKIR